MSFADFSKSSGPSGPPQNQTTFGNAPAFPWKPPISYPKGPIVPNQNLVQQQEQQLFPSLERVGGHTEIYTRDKVNESPKLTESMALNSESNSTVQIPNFSSKVSVRLEVSHNKPEQQRISPPHIFTSSQRLDRLKSHSDAQTAGRFSPPKLAYGGAPKRSRSPVVSLEEPFHSSSVPLESDREIHAKAKRLARFNIERAHPIQNLNDISRHKLSGSRQDQFRVNPSKTDELMEEVFGGGFSDLDDAKSMKVVGLCPDMCPESEREERERKGDLDKYERLDGDRNQSSKYLAVKKYNRTAEREAELIRPLPVLQRTVAYLLNLLDQPYDGSFLNIYNFLWDRMRAIRMDLRMQHIFNADAIAMLEQMIRIHIIAMHELCEFEKGEGFTEGFDAHLNIEQMNKTSVELFQMYDDHRKKGKIFLSEKEFRGYYALLKLDKHPGYKVEPAELSLDLAKMTPELRCTHEILFARDVARACRIGNYIAFFRLARKATYLQACLMHAHFSKMRKQALTSLHSGLQHNQGIPVGHVEKWLALEGEDAMGLLDFYGFSIKRYEEAYLVKEGPLLNSDVEFPTRCAHLVQSKRSSKIVDDVRTRVALEELPVQSECREDVVDIVDQRKPIDTEMQLNVFRELLDSQVIHSPINLMEPKLFEERPAVILNKENRVKMPQMPAMKAAITSPVEDVGGHTDQDEDQEMVFGDKETLFNGVTFQIDENNKVQPVQKSPIGMIFDLATTVPESQHLEKNVLLSLFNEEEETNMEKLRQILRKWKKHSALRRESREQKEFLANTALSSLSLGPPVRQIQSQQAWSNGGLDIDAITIARFGKYGNSWSRLNISDVVTPIIATRNPSASFFCWKLVLLVQLNDSDAQPDQLSSNWLFSKLFGATNSYDADLVLSSSDLSIWKKWIYSQLSSPKCGLSIVRKIVLEDNLQTAEEGSLRGASSLIYLISETMPWEVQRARLQNLLVSIPRGAELPLLVLSPHLTKEGHTEESIEIMKRLALHEADKTRINSFSVIFLSDSKRLDYANGFFDDHQLRMGLQWLATNSPSYPSLHLVRSRELVFGHLRHYMEVAEKHRGSVAEPDHYVAALNKALDKSAEEITAAASANPTFWPAPEVDLLDQWSSEGIMARHSLPSLGWSSPCRIIPVVRAFESCKLPGFPDLSWLNRGSLTGDQVKQQKLALEESLIIYLNESCKLLKADLAAWEARVMLQHGASLELRESGYFIVPKWNLIFQRIYCWQLNRLINQDVSKVYVLAEKDGFIAMDATRNPQAASQLVSGGFKECPSSSCFEDLPLDSLHSEVSLDELIEMCCVGTFENCSLVTIPTTPRGGDEAGGNADASMSNQPDRHPPCSDSHEISGLVEANGNITVPLSSKNDRLTGLLERCRTLQDMIEQKLAIYF